MPTPPAQGAVSTLGRPPQPRKGHASLISDFFG